MVEGYVDEICIHLGYETLKIEAPGGGVHDLTR
jgi:hypothetical protein